MPIRRDRARARPVLTGRYVVIAALKHVAVLALVVASLVLPTPAADPPGGKPAKPKHTNRLAREISPYLLQHAHNPVDWFPWGEEAFAKAKKEGKLVFLSIGYSSCHWCHVMEKESFADEGVAKILNENYVPIKVDREERPDIDQVYMASLHAYGQLGGRSLPGGWPLSMFLTADGKPIAGGTYWPREDQTIEGEQAPGFKTILRRIRGFTDKEPKALKEQADKVAAATSDLLIGAARGIALVALDRELVAGAVTAIKEEFDGQHGGFGSAERKFRGTKFPLPPYLRLLQHEAARTKAKDLEEVVRITLDHMARGGIYDHLGGGFHRYSTERSWTVPHFEKMLYDNAQLLEVYARAYSEANQPHYRQVMKQTLAFVGREMTSPEGGFYSALDADSEGEEGKFYVWTEKEIDAVLPDRAEADLIKKVYGADGPVNFEEKFHIFTLPVPLAERAARMKMTEAELEARLAGPRQKLFAVRAKRPRPFLDTKVLTAWNGQMIAGVARAGQALEDNQAVQAAVTAADFVLKNLRTRDGRLLRAYGAAPGGKAEARINAYLDDYAFLVHGLLTLHDVTGEARWLDAAKSLTDVMVKYHADGKNGGFYYTAADHDKLFARAKDQYDAAQPSGNSVAARNLVRLWRKTGDNRYAALAEKTLKAFAGPMKLSPSSLTCMAEALALYLDGGREPKGK
jgi:uncharacterized protein YyaL (SSP411 family)